MHHFYDECPASLEYQEARLNTVQTLSKAGIPCLIHGEDALCFVHWVPTMLFDLNIIVSDQDVQRAHGEIMAAHPYEPFTGIDQVYNEALRSDPNRTRTFPNSIFLKGLTRDVPRMIIIHPETDFNVVVADYSRSVPLPPFPDNIRFPTKAAFLDSTIEVRLDPNWGRISLNIASRYAVWISYVIQYCIRTVPYVLPNGDLVPEAEELLRSLKPENQPHFEAVLRDTLSARNKKHAMLVRREALRKLGQTELADRPLPQLPPGNPEYLEWLQRAFDEKYAAVSLGPTPMNQ